MKIESKKTIFFFFHKEVNEFMQNLIPCHTSFLTRLLHILMWGIMIFLVKIVMGKFMENTSSPSEKTPTLLS